MLVKDTRKYSVYILTHFFSLHTDGRLSDNMSASICAFILTFSALCGSGVVSGALSRPTNVRLTSFNMNLVLRWDSPYGAVSDLLYTTEYNTSLTAYRVGCLNISLLECDFTHLSISITEYGKYTGRVRAQLGPEISAWAESNQITLDKDTIIGSPNVSLLSNGASIDVIIKDPVFTVSALRKVYIATYNITYWEYGQKEKARSISNIEQSRVVLNDLDLWTKYCVQVRINTERNPIPSKPSETVCESTTNNEEAPWVAAVVTFVVMAMAVALVVVTVVYRKSISHFLCPRDALPQHFKEMAPTNSSMYVVIQKTHPPEEIYHEVTVEEGYPLEAGETSYSKQPDVAVEER